MRIGISVCSSYSVEDYREGARNMIERARAARQAIPEAAAALREEAARLTPCLAL